MLAKSKIAFLLALAEELVCHEGSIHKGKGLSSAFATQDPWIMNGSVKENILMGNGFDSQFYNEVVISCGLNIDYKQFIYGDSTIVGDRGVQLSGGQVRREIPLCLNMMYFFEFHSKTIGCFSL
jgi:ATP-binding cassette subfamily C (CFTR/MRP) protein 4